MKLPNAIIGNFLGVATSNEHYAAAKSGDILAAGKLALQLITKELIIKIRKTLPENPIIIAVNSIEESGKNAIPIAAATLIAEILNIDLDTNIVQINKPKRTNLDGLDRIFSSPVFDGEVLRGRNYILLDDTITQGRTFVALAQHIEMNGGHVKNIIALTGKQYSSQISINRDDIKQLRLIFGDIENDFKQITGYGFDGLTKSEARYLTKFKQPDTIRSRILAEINKKTRPIFEDDVSLGAFKSKMNKHNKPKG